VIPTRIESCQIEPNNTYPSLRECTYLIARNLNFSCGCYVRAGYRLLLSGRSIMLKAGINRAAINMNLFGIHNGNLFGIGRVSSFFWVIFRYILNSLRRRAFLWLTKTITLTTTYEAMALFGLGVSCYVSDTMSCLTPTRHRRIITLNYVMFKN